MGAAWIAFRRNIAPGSRLLAGLMLAVAEWELMSALGTLSPELAQKILWAKVQYLGICAVAPLWLLFCLRYARPSKLSHRWIGASLVLPGAVLALAWTNEWHHLIWSAIDLVGDASGVRARFSYGPAFWVAAAYNYTLLLSGTVVLLNALTRRGGRFRGQTLALIVGLCVPWVANFLYLTRVVPVDITSFGFTASSVVSWYALFGVRLVDLAPIARDEAFANIPHPALVVDLGARVVDANPAAEKLLRRAGAALPGQHIDRALQTANFLDVATRDAGLDMELGEADGETRTYHVDVSPLHGGRQLLGYLVLLRDETEARRAHLELLAERDFARQITDAMGQGLLVTDADARLAYVNARLSQMLRMPAESILGRRLPELVPETERPRMHACEAEQASKLRIECETTLADVAGAPVHVLLTRVPRNRDGRSAGEIIVVTDLTARKQMEAVLEHRALHDPLTELPNRRLFHARLEEAFASHRRQPSSLALLVLDLDRFKEVNDSLGHLAGDQLLNEVARRWQRVLRTNDTLARLGGDEFALILSGHPADANAIAERLVRVTEDPFELEKRRVTVGVSVGVAIGGADVADEDELLRRADVAMYAAKQFAGGWCPYSNELEHRARAALTSIDAPAVA